MSEVKRSLDWFWKQVAQGIGCLLALPGLAFSLGGLGWLCLLTSDPALGSAVGIAWLSLELVTLISGSVLLYHVGGASRGVSSKPLRLLPPWVFAWGLLWVVVAGELFRRGGSLDALFFPPVFVLAAALPPLAAMAWAMPPGEGRAGLTWRQFTVLFVAGATVCAGAALFLEIAMTGLVLTLVQGLFPLAQEAGEALLKELAGNEVSRTLASQGFVLALVQLAVVAPLVEELVKPLAGLPLIRRASGPRQAFLVGAAAGAGFATLENVLYAGAGIRAWGGIVIMRALGAAVHPLGAGLVAVGWYEFFAGRGRRFLPKFGMALGVHALWNGGLVLFLALAEADFFGASPPRVEVLGLAELGVLLALLAVLGAGAWFGLRAAPGSWGRGFLVPTTDRALAIWAVVCLAAALSIGLAALNVLGGG
jgi:RsiW-degrading membrane proteinase PrsW (M82 family)